MVKIGLKLPWGFKAQAKRDGFTVVKYANDINYHLRRKSNPKLVENNQHFNNNVKMLSIAYQALSDEDVRQLTARRIKEGNAKSNWLQFMREFYRNRKRKSKS